jgi:hypothetical protein
VLDQGPQQLPAMWTPAGAPPAVIAKNLANYLREWWPTETLVIDTNDATISIDDTRIGTYTVTPIETDLRAVRG